jgi:hypothetical protein
METRGVALVITRVLKGFLCNCSVAINAEIARSSADTLSTSRLLISSASSFIIPATALIIVSTMSLSAFIVSVVSIA